MLGLRHKIAKLAIGTFSLSVGFTIGLLLVPMTFKEQIVLRDNQAARRYFVCFSNFQTSVLRVSNDLVRNKNSGRASFEKPSTSEEIALTISFSGHVRLGSAYSELLTWAETVDHQILGGRGE